MKIGIFSDVHGNPYALKAVLEDIALQRDFTHIIAAGDLVFGGSDPCFCLDHLIEIGALMVYGNTEEYIFSPEIPPKDALHLNKWQEILTDVHWVRDQLGEQRIRQLAKLPFDLRFSPTEKAQDGLRVVHANPKNIEDMILPPTDRQLEMWGEIRQPDEDPILAGLFTEIPERTIAFGHFHHSSVRTWRDRLLINVSPVSLPAKDHDPRARYTICQWVSSRWQIEQRYIPYDFEQEIQALKTSGLPNWAVYAEAFPTL